MKMQNTHVSAANSGESDTVIRVLDSLLADSGQKRLTGGQATVILDALANSDDPALVMQFPVVLSICARKGLILNSHALFSKYWESSPKKQNLEKLLLISEGLFKLEGIDAPQNLAKIVNSFKAKYGHLIGSESLSLSSGIRISIADIQNTLKAYAAKFKYKVPAHQQMRLKPEAARSGSKASADLETYLDRLFSPKQKDLVFKKLNGIAFTKTDREYYSRVVRKKLQAIADPEVSAIAVKLTQK